MSVTPAGPIDVVPVLRAERDLLIDLLRSLDEPDWAHPTECPAYDVRGVASHLLGDDLSLLSRQRDSAPNGLLAVLQPGDDFRTALDRFNDRWVEAVRFFSPVLLVELLELAGEWTAEWYAAVEPDRLGEPVGFFAATSPSPYWQIAAREYVERWVHHHQIRRALGRDDLDDQAILQPAVAAVVRGFAAHLRSLDAEPGTSIVLSVDDLAAWTLRRESDGWELFDGRSDDAAAVLGLERSQATPLLSRGLPASAFETAFTLTGDLTLARRAVRGMAALAGR